MYFQELYDEALKRGEEEAKKCVPVPMTVQQHASPVDDASPVVKEWYVPGGVCGFAWVWFPDGRSAVCNFFRKIKAGSKHYQGGYNVRCPLMTQSMQTKEAWARGFSNVFQDAGINCYAQSRMD